MAGRATLIVDEKNEFSGVEFDRDSDDAVERRIADLRQLNEELAIEARDRDGVFPAGFVGQSGPRILSYEKAYGVFGVMLGSLPPAAIALKIFSKPGGEPWFFGIALIVITIASVVGYFSGKAVGQILRNLESGSWLTLAALTPVVGLVWGIIAGMSSGIIIFIIGALFGGVIGGMVGAVALPAFYLLHRLSGEKETIRLDRLLPIGLGVALVISGIIFRL